MKWQTPSYVEFLVFLYCVIVGAGVVNTWGDHPHMQMASLAFIIYLIPVALYWLIPSEKLKKTTPIFQYVAITASLIGYLGSLNTLKYLGIALSLTGFVPWSIYTCVWALSSLSWMPAMAYLFKSFSSHDVLLIRMVFATVASCALSVKLYFILQGKHEQKTT